MRGPNWNERRRSLIVAIFAMASLVAAPAAWSHDDDDDDDYFNDDYEEVYEYDDDYGDGYEYDDGNYGHGYETYVQVESLRRYGSWRFVGGIGKVWFPHVEASWRPYYYGHWIHTPAGMTWVSHEPWGEIPHHYGQWVYVDHYGWAWVPGYDYSPAWVTWGVGDGHVGWAPCPPRAYRYSRYHRYHPDIHSSHYGFSGSFGYHSSGLDFSLWVFVSDHDFYGAPVYRHALPTRHSLSLFKSKRVLPVGSHLDVGYVRKVSKGKVHTYDTDRKLRRIGDRELQLYKPRGQRDKIREGRKAAARNYTKFEGSKRRDVKPERMKIDKRRSDAGRRVADVDKLRSPEKGRVKADRKAPKRIVDNRSKPAERSKSIERRDKPSKERSKSIEHREKPSKERSKSVERREKSSKERSKSVERREARENDRGKAQSKSRRSSDRQEKETSAKKKAK